MLSFAYTGRSGGAVINGVLEGSTAAAVAETLLSRGVTPLTITPRGEKDGASAAGAGATSGNVLHRLFPPKVLMVDLLLFSRQINTLLKSGVPILRALAGLQESAPNPAMKNTLHEVRRSLESGIELSMSFAQHPTVFDNFYVALIRVGEMTGRLDEVFLRLFHHLEFELFMRQQVKSALRYPMFVMAAMIAAIGVINVMVIPAFAGVFKSFNAELPLPTRILLATSEFTVHYGWLLALLAVAGGFALRSWIATPLGRMAWDRAKLRLPIAGKIVSKAMLARFARSFALSLKSGVPVEQALSVVSQTVDNTYIARKVEAMREHVERGETILRSAIGAGIFTPVVLQMIAVGEETGAVDELMNEVAELYSNEVQYELKTLTQQIEPIMIVFLGVLVLILALGVFLPVWDLGSAAFKK